MIRVGSKVRHQTDPHERNTGEVIGVIERHGHHLLKVRWASGTIEYVHVSELRDVERDR